MIGGAARAPAKLVGWSGGSALQSNGLLPKPLWRLHLLPASSPSLVCQRPLNCGTLSGAPHRVQCPDKPPRIMRHLDITLGSPAENLALDEALLLEAEEGQGGEVLRFWASPLPFVVLGVGAKVRAEVFWEACQRQAMPVLRRCSGGGTVLQGPGCLNYALVMRIDPEGPLSSIRGANRFIMERNAKALSSVLNHEVTIEGHTDLVARDRKVSGNAQRRLRGHLLFHGTFLLDFDLDQISRFLRPPPRQPEYRAHRPHDLFIANLHLQADAVKRALGQAWNVPESMTAHATTRTPQLGSPSLHQRVNILVRTRYALEEWNLRF